MKNETKNLIMAIVLSFLVIWGINRLLPSQPQQAANNKAQVQQEQVQEEVAAGKPSVVLSDADEKNDLTIKSNTLTGSLSAKGGRLNDLTFLKFKQTVKKYSPDVVLLDKSFFADFSILSDDKDLILPDENTVWEAQSSQLTPDSPLTLVWNNPQGVKFTRTISLDDEYMFTVTDAVENASDKPISVSFAGRIHRVDPKVEGSTSVHQGFVGVLGNKLQEKRYEAVKTDKKLSFTTTGGWLGLVDKYWGTALAFNQGLSDVEASFSYDDVEQKNIYTAEYKTPAVSVQVNQRAENVLNVFAGPKELKLISAYQNTLNINKFELMIDFGWYYFLTKPFLYILSLLYSWVGNMGVAILIFATVLRILMLPIAGKSFESMAKMKKIQPKMKRLQEMYKNDRMRLQQETLALYKKENVNPASGCLPLLIQIPVFFSLYKVLSVSIEMRQAPFFGWIHDLSMPDPLSVFTLFGLIPWNVPSFLNIGVWPVLMGITMYLQQKMNPPMTPSNDQKQPSVLKWMPVIFTFMMGQFASGLVIYWTWSNVLSIAQQRYVMHKYKVD